MRAEFSAKLLDAAKKTINRHKMLAPGEKVMVAFSGGADSAALLHALKTLGYDVCACHFEHGIRGALSERDMEFVREICEEEGIPLKTGRGDAPAFAMNEGVSIEAAARTLRYAFFEEASGSFGHVKCATAHHMDDQAETLLLRLSRGAMDGLGGIPHLNGIYIRPFRDAPKEWILGYIQENALCFVSDETNGDAAIARNLLRNEIIPLLRRINPSAPENIVRSAEALMQDARLVQSSADLVDLSGGLRLEDVKNLDGAVKRRVFANFARGLGARELSLRHIGALMSLEKTGARADIGGVTVVNDCGVLRPWRVPAESFFAPFTYCETGETLISLPIGHLEIMPANWEIHVKTDPWSQYFDIEKLERFGGLCVRSRRDGDRISPIGCGAKKLKDLFIDKKIPRDARDGVPLIASGGEILWAAGVAASLKIAIDNDTRRAIFIRYVNGTENKG